MDHLNRHIESQIQFWVWQYELRETQSTSSVYRELRSSDPRQPLEAAE